ncbi:MAG: hypothetical protein LBL54_01110 [Clostridiales Family XIII bacterium]|jgi:hypothetical protein|nr:hypothetical protein [Clostridiales Family XIII bacterium]
MKKRTVLLIVLCVALAMSWGMMATACSNNQEKAPTEEPPAEAPTAAPTTDGATTEQPSTEGDGGAGIENPVVESTPDEITDKLGVEFKAPDEYADGAKYSLIGDTVAQMEYSMDSGKGPISVTYRISKTTSDDSLSISGDSNEYATSENATLEGGQQVLIRSGEGTGPGSCLWFNQNVVAGGVSASLLMDPVEEKVQLTDVASFFVDQESKGF